MVWGMQVNKTCFGAARKGRIGGLIDVAEGCESTRLVFERFGREGAVA